MTPHTLAVRVDTPAGPEAIRCANPECGQVIAYRQRGILQPVGARHWFEKSGRERLECPVCKARKTVEDTAA